MRAPRHWDRPPDRPGALARALRPLGAVYAAATRTRLARGARVRPGVPVICVGGLVAGGSGKTPTVIDLVARLTGLGAVPHVVSRGYGGRLADGGPTRVDPARHRAAAVGDEPLLIAAFAPVWIGRDRAAAARAAVAAGATHILLDDGFQDPALAHDLAIVVADAARGFGNGRPIPAGPLREPVAAGLARADFLLTLGDDVGQARFDAAWPLDAPPRLRGRLAPLATGMDLTGQRVFAFAGIAHPDKFFATLDGLGAEVVGRRALGDHQPLGPTLMARLGTEAFRHQAALVTTEKDAVRLPADWRGRVLTVPVRLALDDAGPLDAGLAALV